MEGRDRQDRRIRREKQVDIPHVLPSWSNERIYSVTTTKHEASSSIDISKFSYLARGI